MENKLFRQESLDRISSPEQMRDYMRVTSPRLWMLLAAVVIVLGGFLVYASTTTMETTIELPVTVDEYGLILAELPGDQAGMVEVGMRVRIAEKGGRVVELVQMLDTSENASSMFLIDLDDNSQLPAGQYQAQVVTESVSPIGFLMN